MSTVALVQHDGSLLFEDGSVRAWTDMHSMTAALANHYLANDREGLSLYFPAESGHAPMHVPPYMTTEQLVAFMAHWCSSTEEVS